MGKPPEVVSWVVEELTAPREWWRWHFAGKAMQGFLSSPGDVGERSRANPDICAAWALDQAEALIAKLEEEAPK